jgi:hypothetical protein
LSACLSLTLFYNDSFFICWFNIPYELIFNDWVFIDKLLPILAATTGFCLWVAIGHARVLENMSIIGTLCTIYGFLNINVVFINYFGSFASLAY